MKKSNTVKSTTKPVPTRLSPPVPSATLTGNAKMPKLAAKPRKSGEANTKTMTSRPAARRRPAPAPTQIEALVDVGYGNHLLIRGEGPGLSWDQGAPMKCVEGSKWVWTTTSIRKPLVFKVLINDQVWSNGDNITAPAGRTTTITPGF